MPTGKDFTPEQWREIEEARSRLEAYKLKVQPYPIYPEEQPEAPVQEIIHIVRHSSMGKKEFDLLQQTAHKVDYLEKKLLERQQPKTQSRKFGYRGIK